MDNYLEFIGNTMFKENRLHWVQKNMTPGRRTKNIALHFFYCGPRGPLDMQIQEACKVVECNMRMYAVKPPRIEGSPA